MGATLIKRSSKKTVREAGDGTTTATVLAHCYIKEAYKVLTKQTQEKLKEGINYSVQKVVELFRIYSRRKGRYDRSNCYNIYKQ
jgi:chaperonin GroEL